MKNVDNIYIKRGPKFRGIDDIASQKIRESIERVLALRTEDNATEVGELLDNLLSGKKQNKFYTDFSGTNCFWVRTDENYKIVLKEATMPQLSVTFSSEEELDKKFISLKEFLKDAEYIGRKFIRTKPYNRVGSGLDKSFMDPKHVPLVLYSNGAYMLILYTFFSKNEYAIIQSDYLYDSNFEFYGDKNNNFKDKDALYEAIYKQVWYESTYRIR